MGTNRLEWKPAEPGNGIGCLLENPFTQISGIKETVFEEIALGLENLGVAPEEMIERVCTVVKQLGLEALVAKNPNELSGGQRQKVAFASILAMDADFLVIDEPTSQLDPESSEEVFRIISDLKDRGKSIALVEHKIDLLAQYADRIIVMKQGRIIAEGPTREILTSAAMEEADVARPEVTELAMALAGSPAALGVIPITRAHAVEQLAPRVKR